MNIISLFDNIFKTLNKKMKDKRRILLQGENVWEEKIKKLENEVRLVFESSEEFHMDKKLRDVNQSFNTIHSHHLNHTYTITIEIKRKGEEGALIYISLSKAKINENRMVFVGSLKKDSFTINQHNEIVKTVNSYKKEVILKEMFNEKKWK
jgi:hypothetical protein